MRSANTPKPTRVDRKAIQKMWNTKNKNATITMNVLSAIHSESFDTEAVQNGVLIVMCVGFRFFID